ncbi:MAG: hypothetical protein AAF639_05275 [Chloroflexota bacterium]
MKIFRAVIPNPDRRYVVHQAIHDAFAEMENPIMQATSIPLRPNRFTLEVLGYLIPFEITGESTLLLLPIRKL